MQIHEVLVKTRAEDAGDARDLVDWALEASEVLGPCDVIVVPDGSVVIDRARFARLREYVAADRALAAYGASARKFNPDYDAAYDRMFEATAALLPTDTDPLP
jgi:hypothetical protein